MTGPASGAPLRLKDMTPAAVLEAARAHPWLIVPVGTTEHQGPHLPLGADTIIVERLADDLSAEFRVLRAPAIEYGVNDPHRRRAIGGASVRRKTLRRWVNDLVPDWEQLGIAEILILTMNGYAPHTEALGTVVASRVRVRVLDILAIDLGPLVEYPEDPIHGGEVDTSLLLYIRPDLARMDLAIDCILPEEDLRRYRRGSVLALPAMSAGSIGRTTTASPEKGRRIYEHILGRIRERVFAPGTAP
jgi:creatinine amidohydrolase